MGGLFAFFLILIIIILFVAISVVGSLVGGILNFFGLGSSKRRQAARGGKSDGTIDNSSNRQSEEGAERMKKFKKVAEDTEFEIIIEEEQQE